MLKQPVKPVVFQPQAYQGMQRGINRIANVVRPTLGPFPRAVAIEQAVRTRTPEVLDNGATIARRIIELPNRDEDMGAMFIRHVLRHVGERAGDGTATAAVLFQAVYNGGIRYLAAGGNAMELRRALEKGTREMLIALRGMTQPVGGRGALTRLAHTLCQNETMAELMGEIFDIIGEHGRLEIRNGQGREMEREYAEGMFWRSELMAREMATDPARLRAELTEAALFLSDLDITEPESLLPLLTLAKQNDLPGLLIVANSIAAKAMALLLANNQGDGFKIAAVKAPGVGLTKRGETLGDMALLTGGRPFLRSAGQQSLHGLRLTDLGRARRVWADRYSFGVIGGRGDPKQVRQHLAALRRSLPRVTDPDARQDLQERIGQLTAGSATLFVGGATDAERVARKELAEQTAGAMRGAIRDGILPGGGIALLAIRPRLQTLLDNSTATDEQAAYRILIDALAEPTRTIAANAGYDPGAVLSRIAQAGPGCGFDVTSGQTVDMLAAGIVDVATALKTGVQSAVAGAALALTTDVLVHHKQFKPANTRL